MITITRIAGMGYMVNMGVPELHVVGQIATAYSISTEDAIVAIINRGMDSIGRSIAKAADPRVPNSEKNDTD